MPNLAFSVIVTVKLFKYRMLEFDLPILMTQNTLLIPYLVRKKNNHNYFTDED